MQRRAALTVGRVALCVVPMAFAATAIAQVNGRTEERRAVKRVAPEHAVVGFTAEQQLTQRRELHDWLTAQLPDGSERVSVNVTLTERERASLEGPEAADDGFTPMRVGVVKPITPAVGLLDGQKLRGRAKATNSAIEYTKDGGVVWVTNITSPGAVSVRVHFAEVSLPEGAALYILNDRGEAYGPYVGAGPDGSGEFWSNSVTSSTATIMLRQPGPDGARALNRVTFKITEVAHIAKDFPRVGGEGGVASFCSFNDTCIENASCTNEPAIADAELAVAKLRWISGAFVNICSGGLIADTDSSTQIPYLLTANHCIGKGKDAKNLECYFQYQIPCGSSACAGSFDPAPSPSTLGATIKAHGTSGDYSLLQLNQNPPAGSVFLGWNNSPIAFTNGADLHRVSHPSGAPLAYSHHQVDTAAGTCTSWPRGERIYSNDVFGATEGGSSGSPVVNAAGEIVGQLSGCCGFNCGNVCDAASNSTVDGAFAFYFSNVASFLDPSGGCVPSAEICDNGVDDDCDGFIDCNDSDCSGDPACSGGTCGGNHAACTSNADCCSGNCKRGSCKGN